MATFSQHLRLSCHRKMAFVCIWIDIKAGSIVAYATTKPDRLLFHNPSLKSLTHWKPAWGKTLAYSFSSFRPEATQGLIYRQPSWKKKVSSLFIKITSAVWSRIHPTGLFGCWGILVMGLENVYINKSPQEPIPPLCPIVVQSNRALSESISLQGAESFFQISHFQQSGIH